MSKFKPGQKVVCIKYHPDYIDNLSVRKGDILTVRGFSKCSIDTNETLLLFEELVGSFDPINGQENGYAMKYFEPLIEPATGFIEVSFAKVVETEPKICAS